MSSDRLRSLVPMFGGGTRYVETLDAVIEFVEGNQLANSEPSVVHERDDCLVSLLQVVGTGRVTCPTEVVDLDRSEPHFCANFGI